MFLNSRWFFIKNPSGLCELRKGLSSAGWFRAHYSLFVFWSYFFDLKIVFGNNSCT